MKHSLLTLCLLGGLSTTGLAQVDTLRHFDPFGLLQAPLEQDANPAPWGFRYGTGINSFYEFAEKYYTADTRSVVGIIVLLDEFNSTVSTENEAWVSVYQSANPRPASKAVGTEKIVIKDLKLGQNNPNIILFTTKPDVKDSFYASFGFPKYPFNPGSPGFKEPEDKIGVLTTEDRTGDPEPNINWRNVVRYSGGNWETPMFAKGDDLNFCIVPILMDRTTGTFSTANGLQISNVYPNPVVNQASLQINSPANATGDLLVYTLSGQVVHQQSLNLAKGDNSISLSLEELTTGEYIALVKTSQGFMSFMVNKL